MENDDGFIQVPDKHPLQWKKQICNVNLMNVYVYVCEREKDKYCREILIIFNTVWVCVYLYVRVQRWSGVTDSFPPPQLPIWPPSRWDPLLFTWCGWAGRLVVLSWRTHTHTPIKHSCSSVSIKQPFLQINTFINWFLQVLQFTCWIEKNTKMSWIMGSVGFRVFGATPGPKIWDILVFAAKSLEIWKTKRWFVTPYLCVTLGCDWAAWRGVLDADRLTELWWQQGWCCCWLGRGCCSDVSYNTESTDSDCSLSTLKTPVNK